MERFQMPATKALRGAGAAVFAVIATVNPALAGKFHFWQPISCGGGSASLTNLPPGQREFGLGGNSTKSIT